MDTATKYLLLVLALSLVQISFSESRLNEKRRNKSDRRFHSKKVDENICDLGDREEKVHCYCDNTDPMKASWANCWVFNALIENDPLWSFFKKQSNIESLSFSIRSKGALTFVPLNLIHRLNHLSKFSIFYGFIPKIEKDTFVNLAILEEIKLVKSEITELDFSSFAHLPALVNLTVKENKISEIQRDVFVDLPNLICLDLTSNTISLVHDGCFEQMPLLSDLLLEGNSISVLTRETFRGLGNLTRLDLRSNRLTMIGDYTFAETRNLNELLLDNNEITYFSGNAFDGLSLLQKLSMTGNRIKLINEGLLEGVRALELLDLRNNELEIITFETIKPILENLKAKSSVLYLSGNKLPCDCRLGWIKELRNETQSEPLRLALDEVTCIPNTSPEKTIPNVEESQAISDNADSDFFQQYDDLKPSDESVVDNQQLLLDIPIDTLLCKENSEDSLMLSSKDNSYWNTNSSPSLFPGLMRVFVIILTLKLFH